MNANVISLDSLPKTLLADLEERIHECSVGLVLNGIFIGSGTLIEWKGNFGILTARHVVTNSLKTGFDFSDESTQRLHVIASTFPSASEFPVSSVVHIDLGAPVSEEFGPDISVLRLPPTEQLGTLKKERKRFWQILSDPDQKLAAALSDRGFIAISGFPGERVAAAGPQIGFRQTSLAKGIIGFSQAKYFHKGGFDYLEVGMEVGSSSIAPSDRGGLSGGGVWRVRVERASDPANALCIHDVTLAGVIFYDTDLKAAKTTLRCHGPETVYKTLVAKL